MAIGNVLTGCAGEHFVAYRLSAMGYLVALTRGGSNSVDLFVGTRNGQNTVTVQVKTGTNAHYQPKKKLEKTCWNWRVGSKAKVLRGKSIFYAFVDLKGGAGEHSQGMEDMPHVFIVPSEFVADHLNLYPKPSDPKKEPTDFWFDIPEKDTNEWLERWDLLKAALGTQDGGLGAPGGLGVR